MDDDTCSCLYVAGALHDIGKLMIPENILEKPGRLTKEEYTEIQNHAMGTYRMLSDIEGLEDITRWPVLSSISRCVKRDLIKKDSATRQQ